MIGDLIASVLFACALTGMCMFFVLLRTILTHAGKYEYQAYQIRGEKKDLKKEAKYILLAIRKEAKSLLLISLGGISVFTFFAYAVISGQSWVVKFVELVG